MRMFVSVLKERHDLFKSGLDGMLDALANNNQSSKLEACRSLNQVAQNLSSASNRGLAPILHALQLRASPRSTCGKTLSSLREQHIS